MKKDNVETEYIEQLADLYSMGGAYLAAQLERAHYKSPSILVAMCLSDMARQLETVLDCIPDSSPSKKEARKTKKKQGAR